MNNVILKFLTLSSITLSIFLSINLNNRKLSISLEEKDQGYLIYKSLGLKFKLSQLWEEYSDNIIIEDLGNTQDKNNPIYGGKRYSFTSDGIYLDLFSIIVFNEDKLNAEVELSKITNMNYNKNISSISGYSFYFCINKLDDLNLPEKDKIIYMAIYNDIENVLKSLKTYKPIIENPIYSL